MLSWIRGGAPPAPDSSWALLAALRIQTSALALPEALSCALHHLPIGCLQEPNEVSQDCS